MLLKKAPILQAIFEVRFSLNDGIDKLSGQTLASKIHEKLGTGYLPPSRREKVDFKISIKDKSPTVEKVESPLWSIASEDQKLVLQISASSISIVRTQPYLGWEDFRNIIVNAISILWEDIPLKKFERIGLRYINQIDPHVFTAEKKFPVDLSRLLRTLPLVAPAVDMDLKTFLLRTNVKKKDSTLQATVTLQDRKKQHSLAIALDIDVFMSSLKNTDKSYILESLEEMRGFKNDLFFGSISNELREHYA